MTDRNLDTREIYGDVVGATLVTTLVSRAQGAERFGVDDWDDPQARQALAVLQRIAADHGDRLEDLALTDEMNVVGTIRRSQDFDQRVREFAGQHERIQVVSLGIGLCNRAARLADINADWVGLDNPSVIALRREVLPDDVTTLIAGSVTDRDWLAELDPTMPTVLACEGLLMYLDPPAVTQLLNRIADRLTGPTRLIADLHYAGLAKLPHPITRRTGARYRFGVRSPGAFARLSPGWRLVGVDDTMARIRPSAARASRVFQKLSGGLLYAVLTIEREGIGPGVSR